MITKYADITFLDSFRERKLIFKQGEEFLVETGINEFQAYFVTENGRLVESDIYKLKQKNSEEKE